MWGVFAGRRWKSAMGMVRAAPPGRIEFFKTLSGYIPTNFVDPFRENLVITIILLAVVIGLALRAVKHEQTKRGETGYRAIEDLVAAAFQLLAVPFTVLARRERASSDPVEVEPAQQGP